MNNNAMGFGIKCQYSIFGTYEPYALSKDT